MLERFTSLRPHFSRRALAQGIVEYGVAIAVVTAAAEAAVSQVGDKAADVFSAVGTALEQPADSSTPADPFPQ